MMLCMKVVFLLCNQLQCCYEAFVASHTYAKSNPAEQIRQED